MSRSPISVMVLSAMLLTACSSTEGTTGTDAGPPRSGGALRLALPSAPDCIDPQQSATTPSLSIARQLVDSLTDQDPSTGEIRPWLAEKWETSPDSTSFTFHLRPGATFSDGTPLDANAVRTNFDQIKALGAKAQLASGYLASYQGTTVIDPQTVKVEFSVSNAQFLQASSTMSLGLLAPTAYRKTPEERCQGDGLIGSGPFVFESFEQNQQIVLTKRRGYHWGSTLFKHQGEAYLDRIVYQIVPEPGVRTGSLVSGQLDAITGVQPADEPAFSGNGFTEPVSPNPGVVFNLQANITKGVLADEKVRQAVLKGIDRPEITNTVLTPNYKPATSILSSPTPYYTDLSTLLTYDPAGAKALLDSAGWTPGPDGIRTKAGQRLTARVVYSLLFNQSKSVLELLQQQLRRIGFDLQLEQHTAAETTQIQLSGNYEYYWYNFTRADPDILRVLFSAKAGNRSRLPDANPLEAPLAEQASTVEPDKRGPAVERAQRLIIENAYAAPVFEHAQVMAFGPNAHDVNFEASSRLQLFDAWMSGT